VPTTLRDEAAIVGIGETSTRELEAFELQLGCEALRAAIADCGVEPAEIDGMSSFTMDSTDEIELARALGIGELRFLSKAHHAAARRTATLHQAAMAVATGAANYVVCYRTLNGRSGHRFSMGVSGELITSDTIHYSWYMPSGCSRPRRGWRCFIAACAQVRHHGEQLGHVATRSRDFRGHQSARVLLPRPALDGGYLASRWIVEPVPSSTIAARRAERRRVLHRHHARARARSPAEAALIRASRRLGPRPGAMTSFLREDIGRSRRWTSSRASAEDLGPVADDIDAAVSTTHSRRSCSAARIVRILQAGEAQEFAAVGGSRAAGGCRPTPTGVSSPSTSTA